MGTILVAIDSPPAALRVLPYAMAIARATHSQLLLYWAIPDEGLRQYAEGRLAHLTQIVWTAGVSVATEVECRAHAGPAILEAAARAGADMLALATKSKSGVDRWLNGSIADELVRHADAPVLVVPHAASQSWSDDQALRVLVPLDGSAGAAEALPLAGTLADALEAEVWLLGVAADSTPDRLGVLERYLEDAASTLPLNGGRLGRLAVVGDASSQIAEVAGSHGANLIVMATRGRGGLARLHLGSVATATVQRASMPVVLVRPRGTALPVHGRASTAKAG